MIHVDAITKKFGHETVLDRLSLEIAEGELLVLLGKNGAGKTTLLKCLVGLYMPIAGTITIGGLDRRADHLEIRRFTAWLGDRPNLYWTFTGRGWLEMMASIYGVERETSEAQIAELLEIFELTGVAGKRIAYYSNGQYKKLAIASTLVTNARLYLLDEPFTGEIDPPGIAAVKEILGEMRRRCDITVVMSTQIADVAEPLASRVGILHEGRIAVAGTVTELCQRYGVVDPAGRQTSGALEDVFNAVVEARPAERARGFLDSFAR